MSFSDVRVCAACGAKNRVGARHLSRTGKCGSCKTALPPIAAPLDVDAAAFDDIVGVAAVPVLVDFWASWCGPCRMAAPEVAALASELAGSLIVLKVNTEEQPQLSARYGIRSIPSFIVFRNGRVAMQRAGAAPRAEMRKWVAANGL